MRSRSAARVERLLAAIAAIAALGAAMFVWAAAPVAAACIAQTGHTTHAAWSLTRDATSCTASQNEERAGEEFEVVAPDSAGFVALGRTAQDPTTGAAREWASFTSATGSSWDAHPLPFPAIRLETGVAMAARSGSIVAVGAGFGGRTADGITWQAGTTSPAATSRVVAVTGSSAGWLAVGQTTRTSGHAAAWFSADGLTWTPVRDQASFGQFCVTAVAWRANRYVVSGSNCNGRPAILESGDGRSWRRAPTQSAFARPGIVRDVTVTASGFLAAGDDRSASNARGTAFWTSTDGLAWRRVAFFSAAKGGETLHALVRTTAGYFGISDTGSIVDGLPPAAFFSTTGATWTRDGLLPNPGFGSEDGDWLNDATALANRIVIVGRFNDIDPGSSFNGGLVWTGDAHR